LGRQKKKLGNAWRVAITYIIFSVLWIIITDSLLLKFFRDAYSLTRFQTYKGWLFVLLSGILIYFSITFEFRKRRVSEEGLRTQTERLDSLHLIDLAISTTQDFDVLYKIILLQVVKQLNVDAANLLRYDEEKQILETVCTHGFAYQETFICQPNNCPAWKIVKSKAPLSITDLATIQDEFSCRQSFESENFVFYYGFPLIVDDKVSGILEVFHHEYIPLAENWFSFVRVLAGQAAIAMEHVRLVDNLSTTNQELLNSYETTLEGWANALELRDNETKGHSQRVTGMTVRLARKLGFSETDLVHVRRGALLHDIGKMGIPDSILHKPAALDESEWEIMKQHPVYAYNVLSKSEFLKPALDIPYYHHERWDGSGYPKGLCGEEIPLAARIFAVIDVWDALNSPRPYRGPWPEDRIITYIQNKAGEEFDPKIVEAFLELVAQ
jgi:putative nucleotidyltransferase with HDIG domain